MTAHGQIGLTAARVQANDRVRMVEEFRIFAAHTLICFHAFFHEQFQFFHGIEHAAGHEDSAGIILAVEGTADLRAVALLPSGRIGFMTVRGWKPSSPETARRRTFSAS